MVYAVWNFTTFYVVGDIVQYLAGVYECFADNINQQPDLFPGSWTEIGGLGAVNAVGAGTGISVNSALPTNPIVSINVASADARLTITNGTGTQRILNNNCPISIGAGNGLIDSGTNATGRFVGLPFIGTPGVYNSPSVIQTDPEGRVISCVSGNPLQAITSFAYTDTINSIPTTSGTTVSGNIFVAPATGMYLFLFSYVFQNSATVGVQMDATLGNSIQAYTFNAPATFSASSYLNQLTTIPAGATNIQQYQLVDFATLLAGSTHQLRVLITNASSVSWDNLAVSVRIIQLC